MRVKVCFAYKIMDGLYIGNYQALLERDFLWQNKINNLINCASEVIYNGTGSLLQFNWRDEDEQNIVIIENIEKIHDFIELAINKGESVLFFSLRGQSRAFTALASYLMYKYCWSFFKTIQFLNSRRKDFQINASFLKQLINFEFEYLKDKQISRDWDDYTENQEIQVIQNTYLNSQQQAALYKKTQRNLSIQTQRKKNVTWSINLIQQIQTIENKKEISLQKQLKSILKSTFRDIKKYKQFRSVSVNDDNLKLFGGGFIQQSFATNIKLQTSLIPNYNFDQIIKKKDEVVENLQQYQMPKLTIPYKIFTPQKQRNIQNNKETLSLFLNSQLKNIPFIRENSIQTPLLGRIRATSQQNSYPIKSSIQTKESFLIDDQNIRQITEKKLPKFKVQ